MNKLLDLVDNRAASVGRPLDAELNDESAQASKSRLGTRCAVVTLLASIGVSATIHANANWKLASSVVALAVGMLTGCLFIRGLYLHYA